MKKHAVFPILAIITFFVLSFVQPGFSQTSDEIKSLREEIKTLKEGQTAIQKDLQEIKKLLQSRQAPSAPEFKEAVVSVEGGHVKGDKNAKLVLIEFSDYQ